jgi:RNA polymerase sigma factor (sigma-70 family)
VSNPQTAARSSRPGPGSCADRAATARTTDLYERFRAPVYRYCRSQLRSSDAAEDAVQNTFLRVFTALGGGVEPDFEAAWLYKIAHNVCLSRRLSDLRRARIEIPQNLEDTQYGIEAPEREAPPELDRLADALAEMPENMRRVILLREWQGLSYAEIAEALGVSVAAVESLIFRGRRYLANALRPPVEPVAAPVAA